MAKEKETKASKDERKAARKAEKKAASSGGKESKSVLLEDAGVKKSKSDKKDKKEKRKALAEKALNEIEGKKTKKVTKEESDDDSEDEDTVVKDASDTSDDNDDTAVEKETAKSDKTPAARPVGALVPFANPLADDKVAKKVFKSVKKAAAKRTLKRGVKEVVKALRKSPNGNLADPLPVGVVILAADISPMDVISHIPVLAEDHAIPYIYVSSRAELGTAGQTKRPTSVVMVSRDVGKKKEGKKGEVEAKDDGESWEETYKSLVKVVQKEGSHVRI